MPTKSSIIESVAYAVAFVALCSATLAAEPEAAIAAAAPLLAAGIPAFLAVGGGALISLLRDREK